MRLLDTPVTPEPYRWTLGEVISTLIAVAAILIAILTLIASEAHAKPLRHHAAPASSFWSTLRHTGSSLVSAAEAKIGATSSQLGLPRSLWCADFMNQTLRRSGYQGTASREAKSFLALPKTTAHVGAIAVLTRRGGGHVGIVSGFDHGNPVVVSGNHGNRVAESVYPARRVIAYVEPR